MQQTGYSLESIVIADERLKAQRESVERVIRSTDFNRLLAGFHASAGYNTDSYPYENDWEHGDTRGHLVGNYLSAMSAIAWESTDPYFARQVRDVVEELATCQKDNGFLSARSEEEFFIKSEPGEQSLIWYPTYKLLIGLLDAHRLLNDEASISVAKKLAAWAVRTVKTMGLHPENDGCAGMNEAFYLLYEETQDDYYLNSARLFEDEILRNALTQGKDVLEKRNVKLTTAMVLGFLRRFEVKADVDNNSYLRAAAGFFDLVMQQHAFVSGGVGDLELFGAAGHQADLRTNCNAELCGSFYIATLAARLYLQTAKKKYMDAYEKICVNHLMGAVHGETGRTAYFQPMATGNFKCYGSVENDGWCCTGTGLEIAAKLNRHIYTINTDTVYVELFISSALYASNDAFMLEQITDFPATPYSKLIYHAEPGMTINLAIRIPDWYCGTFVVKKDGINLSYRNEDGYAYIEQPVADGDELVIDLNTKIIAHSDPGMFRSMSFTYGPYLLAAPIEDEDKCAGEIGRGVRVSLAKREQLYGMTVHGISVDEWKDNIDRHFLKAESDAFWETDEITAECNLVFVPFNLITEETYGTYFRIQGTRKEETQKSDLSIWRQEKKEAQKAKKERNDTLNEYRDSYKDASKVSYSNDSYTEDEETVRVKDKEHSGVMKKVISLVLILALSVAVFVGGLYFIKNRDNGEKTDNKTYKHFDNINAVADQFNRQYSESEFTALVETIDGAEYLSFAGKDYTVSYKNEYKKSEQYIRINNGRYILTLNKPFGIMYDPLELCPLTGADLIILTPYTSSDSGVKGAYFVDTENLDEYTLNGVPSSEELLKCVKAEAIGVTDPDYAVVTKANGFEYRIRIDASETDKVVFGVANLTDSMVCEGRFVTVSYITLNDKYVGRLHTSYKVTSDKKIVPDETVFYGFAPTAEDTANHYPNVFPIGWADLRDYKNIYTDANGLHFIVK